MFKKLFDRLNSECHVFKPILKRKFSRSDEERKNKGLKNGDILLSMFRYCQKEESMPVLSALLRTAVVTGYSTPTIENSFSARNTIDTD